MDPRQPPQHPFSRNTASPYGRNPFPPSSNQQSSYPPPSSSHAPNTTPSYAEHQRRPSDPQYYNPQRNYTQDGASVSGSSHSRHQSASSVGHGTPVNRAMPPPSSPPQQTPHSYGPPPPRAPPVSVGPPSSFPSSRELPSLTSLGRPSSTAGSSMSISSMLGGPLPGARDQPPQPPYTSPVSTSAPPNAMYPGPAHASPRMSATGADYAPFRRPQTPEHQRGYESRDHRASSASSPTGVGGSFSTPDARRYGTPHSYTQRPSADERRDQHPVRVANTAIPPRPSSQPSAFNAPPARTDTSRAPAHSESIFAGRREPPRAEPLGRPEPPYARQSEYEERQNAAYAYAERARQEREAVVQREVRDREQREQRERERAMSDHNSSLQQEYAHQLAQRTPQGAYNRPEPREQQPSWMRPGYEPPRPAYEPIPERLQPPPQNANGHEFPGTAAPQYGGHAAYAPSEARYPGPQPSPMPPQHSSVPASQYEASIQERQRLAQQQQQQQQSMYGGTAQNGPFQTQESPTRRGIEESQQMQQQRSFLGVQEINRKGRVSPLPQAVQGAQGQLGGPAGEPGIKSEFGRMFSGIGSGVGSAMGVPSPVTSATPQGMPFSNSGQMRRDDMDQDSPVENGRGIPRAASRGGRRRKLKDEDGRGDDESSTGRNTPSGRGKRSKTHHHHHHNHHHHHHHRPDTLENISPPNQTPFKSIKGATIPSPPGLEPKGTPTLHHHHVSRHHHHHVTPAKPPPVANPVIPLPKTTVRSQAVLDAVAHLPRKHLGHAYYKSALKPAGRSSAEKGERGFVSTPQPLPRFEGQENSTFTVKVPKVHLGHASREEITSRRAVWGTDVYTDDSDVVAACIHQGWFRGAWGKDVDVDLLGLDLDGPLRGGDANGQDGVNEILTDPPSKGPMHIPKQKDLHVTILILPALERYASTTRFGIKSREWGGRHDGYKGVHDGLSFMIMSIQWVDGVDGTEGRSGGSRRKIMARELDDAELEAEEAWGNLLVNGKAANGKEKAADESFERDVVDEVEVDGVEKQGNIKGVGMRSWWRKANGTDNEREKEIEKEREIEKIAETMIENANVNTAQDAAMDKDIVKRERISDEVTAAA